MVHMRYFATRLAPCVQDLDAPQLLLLISVSKCKKSKNVDG